MCRATAYFAHSGAALVAFLSILGCVATDTTDSGIVGSLTGESPPQFGGRPDDADAKLRTTLFVLGPNTGFVGFDGADNLNGVGLAATTELLNSSATVIQPRDAALDCNGALYLISGNKGGSIAIYDNPMTATGSRPPDRVVFGDATGISNSPTGIAIDCEKHLLYIADTEANVLLFDIRSPELFNGNVAPLRTFHIDLPSNSPAQICLANGSLYVVDARGGTSDILAFDNPAALVGDVVPDRVITNAGFDNTIGIAVDARDRLWVGVRDLGQVLMFKAAISLDGTMTPDLALSIANVDVPAKPSFATTDSEDTLYMADSNGNAVFVFDLATELTSGPRIANRVIDSAELIAPNRLLLFER